MCPARTEGGRRPPKLCGRKGTRRPPPRLASLAFDTFYGSRVVTLPYDFIQRPKGPEKEARLESSQKVRRCVAEKLAVSASGRRRWIPSRPMKLMGVRCTGGIAPGPTGIAGLAAPRKPVMIIASAAHHAHPSNPISDAIDFYPPNPRSYLSRFKS